MKSRKPLLTALTACALACLSALPLSAEEPYVQWVIAGGGPLALTPQGELLASGGVVRSPFLVGSI